MGSSWFFFTTNHLKTGLILLVCVLAFVLIPFLYWHGVWFGRVLSDSQFLEYLNDQQKPRKIQHALTQIGEGIHRKDPEVQQWYSTVLELAKHPLSEIRISVAWVMGQDALFKPSLKAWG